MPFDGLDTPFGHLEKLDRVIGLLETPDRWVKHTYRSPRGGICLKEALTLLDETQALEAPILKAAEKVMEREFCCIESFNDHPLTMHRDVIRVLRRVRADIVNGDISLRRGDGAAVALGRTPARPAGWMSAFCRKLFA